MKNYLAPGDMLNVTAASDIASGAGVLQGGIFGVAVAAIPTGQTGPIKTTGVFELPKAGSEAWTVGARVYWDAGNSRCTSTAGGNTLIGVAYEAVGNGAGETLGKVRLNGVAP